MNRRIAMKTHRRYAIDFAFYSLSGVYDFDAQCQIMKKIGYDGLPVLVWGWCADLCAKALAVEKRGWSW